MNSRHLQTADNTRSRRGCRLVAGLIAGAAAAWMLGGALAPAARAQSVSLWPKIHQDPQNTAYKDTSEAPGLGLKPTWTYPWPPKNATDYAQIVDNVVTGSGTFTPSGPWASTNVSPNSYNDNYLQVPAHTPADNHAAATARWTLGLTTAGMYMVYVWYPSSTDAISNSQHVTYTIHTASGNRTVTISQSSGGQWVQLGTSSYALDSNSYVEVSNYSDAWESTGPSVPGNPNESRSYVDAGSYVTADAVRIVQDLGAVYSSPAVYENSGLPSPATRAVVFGMVDRDPYQRDKDPEITWGRIVSVDAQRGPGQTPGVDMNKPLWEYPHSTLADRVEVEGPIAGGVYSSPLVVNTKDGQTVFVGADDGQIYALDAATGALRWSGPGQTLDDTSPSGVSNSGFNSVVNTGTDFFGKEYKTTTATQNSDSDSVVYSFSGLEHLYYNVYAWIPGPVTSSSRVPDARYTITSGSTSVTTQVDQADQGGAWANLTVNAPIHSADGTIKVTLSSRTGQSGNLTVVADAIRVIPATIGGFGYCSPTVEKVDASAGRIYCANASGRIMALEAAGQDGYWTKTIWIYPAVRSDTKTFDDAALGGLSITPVVDGSDMYYGSVTGKLGHLTGITGSAPTAAWTEITKNGTALATVGAITASPMVSGSYVYFATSTGRVYKVSTSDGSIAWTYPDDWNSAGETNTAGAFRHSTPALAKVSSAGGAQYIVIGSADGYMHQIPDAGPAGSLRNKTEMQSPGAIESSPATCAVFATDPEMAYAGTDAGIVMGFSLDSNNPVKWGWDLSGETVLSSPGIGQRFVYIGSDDGRMYAFAKDAVGGGWQGGANVGQVPGGEYDDSLSGGSESFDMEVVSQTEYTNPESYLQTSGVIGAATATRQPTSVESRLEWGETIYVLAWTEDAQNANITFQMQNIGQGEQAGTLLTASQPATKSVVVGSKTVYYAKFAWVLDPTKLMTPGDKYTITGVLRPVSKSGKVKGPLLANVPADKTLASGNSKRRNASPQEFAINNPLAISFPRLDQNVPLSGTNGPGWNGRPGVTFNPHRTDSGTAFNGMQIVPTLKATPVRHGANSQPLGVALADRSMLGWTRPNNPQGLVGTLRADRGNLAFPGSPINPLPWESVPGSGVVNTSLDYPDISKMAMQLSKRLDGGDPTRGNTRLLPTGNPAGATTGESRMTTPDPLDVVVEVPRYQPSAGGGSAYGTRVRVWIDSTDSGTHQGELDIADERVVGRPLRGSEVYREFNYAMQVVPDATMYAEETTVDLGKRAVGSGIPPQGGPDMLAPVNTPPAAKSLFRTFTVRNDGNVNISNLRLLNNLSGLPAALQPLGWLYSDQVGTLDFNRNRILDAGEGFALPGRYLVSSLDAGADAYWNGLGVVRALPKPLVGAVAPTTLAFPSYEQYQWAQNNGKTLVAPSQPVISVRVPVGTPAGTYSQVTPIAADMSAYGLGMPVTTRSFTTKVTVREARLTEDANDGSLPQIDIRTNPDEPRWGDAQPAAFRVWTGSGGVPSSTGKVGLYWTSNRFGATTPDPREPWYIYGTAMSADPDYSPVTQFWNGVTAASGLPVPKGDSLDSLFPAPPDGLAGSIVPESARFSAPNVAQNPDNGTAWIAFTGQVTKQPGGGAPAQTEYRIFYARLSDDGSLSSGSIHSIQSQDYTTPKFCPRIVCLSSGNMFMLWHAGLAGSYKLYYSRSTSGAPDGWTRDALLVLPGGVTAAAEPSGIVRQFVNDSAQYLDVVYSGMTRAHGDPDLMLGRYKISNSGALGIQHLARVYNEELRRDTTGVSLFHSRHIGWVRPSNGGAPPSAWDTPNWTKPIIRVAHWNGASYDEPTWVNNVVAQVDDQAAAVVYDTGLPNYGRIMVDASAGTVKFEKLIPGKDRVLVDYTPQTWRLNQLGEDDRALVDRGEPDTGPYAFLEKTRRFTDGRDKSLLLPGSFSGNLAVDRLWTFWREGPGAVHANTIYYSTKRLGLKFKHPVAVKTDGTPVSLTVHDGLGTFSGPFEFDWAANRLYFPAEAENSQIWVNYRSSDGNDYEEPDGFTSNRYKALSWITELPETTLLVDSMVNEGQVCAFPDPDGLRNPGSAGFRNTLIWVFWSSSRVGSSDLYYETISPSFRAFTVP